MILCTDVDFVWERRAAIASASENALLFCETTPSPPSLPPPQTTLYAAPRAVRATLPSVRPDAPHAAPVPRAQRRGRDAAEPEAERRVPSWGRVGACPGRAAPRPPPTDASTRSVTVLEGEAGRGGGWGGGGGSFDWLSDVASMRVLTAVFTHPPPPPTTHTGLLWTRDEHERFLAGMLALGKVRW